MQTTRILLITTGGTIGGNIADDSTGKMKPRSFDKIIRPTIQSIKRKWSIEPEIETFEMCDEDSSDIRPKHWTQLCNIITKRYDEFDSFVIAHGTNTLGYTSAALSFALTNINKPVILTGSQVPFGDLGADALMNLQNAIRIAVWPYDQIKGVMVVFGSRIITGTRVKKSTEFDYDAFKSFSVSEIGQIGRVININKYNLGRHNDYLKQHSQPALMKASLKVASKFESQIVSLTEFPGMSEKIFDTLLDSGVKGFILRAFGAGDPFQGLRKTFERLKKKNAPLIVTTQAPNGNSNFQVNQPGQILAEMDLAIPAFDMSIEAITTKLSWLLAQKTPFESMKSEMHKDLHGEIRVTQDIR